MFAMSYSDLLYKNAKVDCSNIKRSSRKSLLRQSEGMKTSEGNKFNFKMKTMKLTFTRYCSSTARTVIKILFVLGIFIRVSDARRINNDHSDIINDKIVSVAAKHSHIESDGLARSYRLESSDGATMFSDIVQAIMYIGMISIGTLLILTVLWMFTSCVRSGFVDAFMTNGEVSVRGFRYGRATLSVLFSALVVSVLFIVIGSGLAVISSIYLFKVHQEDKQVSEIAEDAGDTYKKALEARLAVIPEQMLSAVGETSPNIVGLIANATRAVSKRFQNAWKPVYDSHVRVVSHLASGANNKLSVKSAITDAEKFGTGPKGDLLLLSEKLNALMFISELHKSKSSTVAELKALLNTEQPRFSDTKRYLEEAKSIIQKEVELIKEFTQKSTQEVLKKVISANVSLEKIPQSMAKKMKDEANSMVKRKITEIEEAFKIVEGMILADSEKPGHSKFEKMERSVKFYFGVLLPLIVLVSLGGLVCGFALFLGSIIAACSTKCFSDIKEQSRSKSCASYMLGLGYYLSSMLMWVFWALSMAGLVLSFLSMLTCISASKLKLSGQEESRPPEVHDLPDIPAAMSEVQHWKSCDTLQDLMNGIGAGHLLYYDTRALESVKPNNADIAAVAKKTVENIPLVETDFISSAMNETENIGDSASNVSMSFLESSTKIDNQKLEKLVAVLGFLADDTNASRKVKETAEKLKEDAETTSKGISQHKNVLESLSMSFKAIEKWAERAVKMMQEEKENMKKWNEFVKSESSRDVEGELLRNLKDFTHDYSVEIQAPLDRARNDSRVCQELHRSSQKPTDVMCEKYLFPALIGWIAQYLIAMFLTLSTICAPPLRHVLVHSVRPSAQNS